MTRWLKRLTWIVIGVEICTITLLIPVPIWNDQGAGTAGPERSVPAPVVVTPQASGGGHPLSSSHWPWGSGSEVGVLSVQCSP